MKGTVCITGKLAFGTRDQFTKFVQSKGWIVVSTVTPNLTYLITNNPYSGSQKNLKAQRIGATVITEEEFMDILNEDDEEVVTNVQDSKINSTTTKKEDPFDDFPYPLINTVDSNIPDYAKGTGEKFVLDTKLHDEDNRVVLDTDALKAEAQKNPEVENWLNMVKSLGVDINTPGTQIALDAMTAAKTAPSMIYTPEPNTYCDRGPSNPFA